MVLFNPASSPSALAAALLCDVRLFTFASVVNCVHFSPSLNVELSSVRTGAFVWRTVVVPLSLMPLCGVIRPVADGSQFDVTSAERLRQVVSRTHVRKTTTSPIASGRCNKAFSAAVSTTLFINNMTVSIWLIVPADA